MVKKYPLKLIPVTKQAIWGGTKLLEKYNKTSEFATVAESWELTVRGDGMCTVENGMYAGLTLAEYIGLDPANILGAEGAGERFPLLVKFLDAFDDLSVQVHPGDDYALKNENDLGKMEMWYIMEAEPGAQLVYGLADGCSTEMFREAVAASKTGSVLRYVPVQAGECYFIPHGLVHAIGAGILIAEIQQNSNVTYRVYDYDRRQADGSLRQLHVAQAMDVVRTYTDAEIAAARYSVCPPENEDVLCDCQYFKVTKYTSSGDAPVRFTVDENSFASVLSVASEGGQMVHDGISYDVLRGDSYFLPAGSGEIALSGDITVLVSVVHAG